MDASNIIDNVEDISLSSSAEGSPKFCEHWPTGRKSLKALQEMIKNPIAKGAIGIAIAAGDAVAAKKCGGNE